MKFQKVRNKNRINQTEVLWIITRKYKQKLYVLNYLKNMSVFCSMSDSLLLSLITSNRLQNLERQSDLVDILVPRDCSEVQSNKSGIYIIQPLRSIEPFIVYCDLETNEGGWTVSF